MQPGMPTDAGQGRDRTGLIPTLTVCLTLAALASVFVFFAQN